MCPAGDFAALVAWDGLEIDGSTYNFGLVFNSSASDHPDETWEIGPASAIMTLSITDPGLSLDEEAARSFAAGQGDGLGSGTVTLDTESNSGEFDIDADHGSISGSFTC